MTQDELQVVISARIDPLQKELKKVQSALDKVDKSTAQMNDSMQKSFSKSIASISKAKVALTALGYAAIKTGKKIGDMGTTAIAIDSQMGTLSRTMGSSTNDFLDWGRTTATQFGISERAAIQFGGQFSSIVARSAEGTKEVKDMTQELLQAAAITAANMSQFGIDEVMERMRSGMSGRNEAIEDLGIEVKPNVIKSTQAYKQAVQQTGRAWEQMTEAQQANVRLQAISEQAFNRYGTTLQQNAQQVAMLRAQIDNMKLAWSRAFAPIVQFVIPVLQTLVGWLQLAAAWAQAFLSIFFKSGNTAKATSKETKKVSNNMEAAAGAVGDMGTGFDKANKKAKKLQKTLFGFDVIHNIDEPAEDLGSAGGGGGGVAPGIGDIGPIELEGFEEGIGAFQELNDQIKAMQDRIIAFGEAFKRVIGDITKVTLGFIAFLGTLKLASLLVGITKFDPKGIMYPIMHGLKGGFSSIFTNGMPVDAEFSGWVGRLTHKTTSLINKIYIPGLVKSLDAQGFLGSFGDNMARGFDNLLSGKVGTALLNFTSGIGSGLLRIQMHITDRMVGLLMGVPQMAAGFFDAGFMILDGFWEGVKSTFVGAETIGEKVVALIVAPFKGLQGALAPIMEGFGSLFSIPGAPIAILVAAIVGIGFAVRQLWKTNEEFKSKWQTAWVAVKESVKNLLDFFTPFVATMLAYFKMIYTDGLKPMWEGFVEMVRIVGGKLAELIEHAMPVVEFFVKIFGGQIMFIAQTIVAVISEMVASIARTMGKLLENVGQVLGGVIDFFVGLIQFIKGVFTGDFTGAMNGIRKMFDGVWNGMIGTVKFVWNTILGMFKAGGSIFKGFVGSVANVFKSVVNGLIKGINTVIAAPFKALNASFAKFRKISIMGAKPFGWLPNIGIPSIPAFATGGFPEDGLFFANSNELVGKFTNGKTAVANNAQIVEGVSTGVAQAVSQVLAGQSGGNGSPINLTVQIGSKTIAKETIDAVDDYTMRTGYTFKTV